MLISYLNPTFLSHAFMQQIVHLPCGFHKSEIMAQKGRDDIQRSNLEAFVCTNIRAKSNQKTSMLCDYKSGDFDDVETY